MRKTDGKDSVVSKIPAMYGQSKQEIFWGKIIHPVWPKGYFFAQTYEDAAVRLDGEYMTQNDPTKGGVIPIFTGIGIQV